LQDARAAAGLEGGRGVSAPAAPPMRELVERALAQVPPGRVTTYGDIARALGEIKAARAVGEILSTNAIPETVPCHRVVMQDGTLGGYAFGGPESKARLLLNEGVPVRAGRVEPLDAVAGRAFDLQPLFAAFAARQERLAREVSIEDLERPPKVAIGVDAAYARADVTAFAAAVAVDLNTMEEFASAVVEFQPPVPYVPGYLAFRELPGIVAAVRKLPAEARRRAVVFTDGQGILHPRRCGIASMAGIELAMPAVGTAKGKLMGVVSARARTFGAFEARRVKVGGEWRGFELTAPESKHAIYVSPGTGMGVAQAGRLAAQLTAFDAPSPLPVLLADARVRKSRAEASP
jgi:deoxyribonuclease V